MTPPEQLKREWSDLMQPGIADDFFAEKPRPAFGVITDRFHCGVAWWMSEFSRLIYRQEADEITVPVGARTRARILEDAATGWREVAFLNGLARGEERKRSFWRPARPAEDTQAAILTNDSLNCSVLVFRGTLETLDLLTDLSILAWPLRFKLKGSAHLGFIDALETVWDQVEQRLLSTPGRIFVTGHSLGGALATLAACRILGTPELAGRIGALYTFGSPRVGTAGFEDNLSGVFHARVVHGEDLVPQVPPGFSIPPFPRYRHVGWLYHLRDGGATESAAEPNQDVADAWAAAMEMRDMLKGLISSANRWPLGAVPRLLKDHTPLLYSRGLYAGLAG